MAFDASNVNPLAVSGRQRAKSRTLRVAVIASVALHFAVAFWAAPTLSTPPPALQATIIVASAPRDEMSVAPASVNDTQPAKADSQEPAATKAERPSDVKAATQSTPQASPVGSSATDQTPPAAAGLPSPLEASREHESEPAATNADKGASEPAKQALSGTDSSTPAPNPAAVGVFDPGDNDQSAPHLVERIARRAGEAPAPVAPSAAAPAPAPASSSEAAGPPAAAPAPSNEAAGPPAPLAHEGAESVFAPATPLAPTPAAPRTATAATGTASEPHVFIVRLRPATGPPEFPDSPQELPLRVDLGYKLFAGTQRILIGDATYSFKRTGDSYRIVGVGHAQGFAATLAPGEGKLESRGVITSIGLQPQEFSIERGSPDKREVARFDWSTGIVDLYEHQREQFDPWTSDPMTFMWQFHFSPPKTNQMNLSVATTRRIYRYTVNREGREKIVWSNTAVNTEIWHRRSEDGKTDSYVWLAPSLHFVPVKVRVIVANVGPVEAVLESLRVEQAPAN